MPRSRNFFFIIFLQNVLYKAALCHRLIDFPHVEDQSDYYGFRFM